MAKSLLALAAAAAFVLGGGGDAPSLRIAATETETASSEDNIKASPQRANMVTTEQLSGALERELWSHKRTLAQTREHLGTFALKQSKLKLKREAMETFQEAMDQLMNNGNEHDMSNLLRKATHDKEKDLLQRAIEIGREYRENAAQLAQLQKREEDNIKASPQEDNTEEMIEALEHELLSHKHALAQTREHLGKFALTQSKFWLLDPSQEAMDTFQEAMDQLMKYGDEHDMSNLLGKATHDEEKDWLQRAIETGREYREDAARLAQLPKREEQEV